MGPLYHYWRFKAWAPYITNRGSKLGHPILKEALTLGPLLMEAPSLGPLLMEAPSLGPSSYVTNGCSNFVKQQFLSVRRSTLDLTGAAKSRSTMSGTCQASKWASWLLSTAMKGRNLPLQRSQP